MKHWISLTLWVLLASLLSAQNGKKYVFSAPKMGTTFRLVIYAGDSSRAAIAADLAFQRVDELNQIMSDYELDSEINRLAARAKENPHLYYPVSADLWTVLEKAQKLSRRSRGAFDVTVGPLSRLWRRAFRRREFPERPAIEEAAELVNYRCLKMRKKDRAVRLKRPGMRIDLGGIAKGYAVDAAYEVIRKHGFPRALVDGGGDIYAGEPPPGEPGWKVVRKILENGEPRNEITYLRNQAIATSGDSYRYLEWNGQRYSHLIHPKTGLGATDRRQVTVQAPTCTTADALASTLSVIRLEKTFRLARRYDSAFRIQLQQTPGTWEEITYRPN